MREKQNGSLLFFLTIIGWATNSILLYPLPQSEPGRDAADWLLRTVVVLAIVVGLIAIMRTHHYRSRAGFFIFTLSLVFFFMIIALGSDSVVYSYVIDKLFLHRNSDGLSWALILGGGHGAAGVIQTLVCSFFNPVIFVYFWIVNFSKIYLVKAAYHTDSAS